MRELPLDFLSNAWTSVSRESCSSAGPFQEREEKSLSSLASTNPFSSLTTDDAEDDASFFSNDWVGLALEPVPASDHAVEPAVRSDPPSTPPAPAEDQATVLAPEAAAVQATEKPAVCFEIRFLVNHIKYYV